MRVLRCILNTRGWAPALRDGPCTTQHKSPRRPRQSGTPPQLPDASLHGRDADASDTSNRDGSRQAFGRLVQGQSARCAPEGRLNRDDIRGCAASVDMLT